MGKIYPTQFYCLFHKSSMCSFSRKFLRKNLLISCLDINHNLERYRVIFILTQLAIETSDLISGPDIWQLQTTLMLSYIENASGHSHAAKCLPNLFKICFNHLIIWGNKNECASFWFNILSKNLSDFVSYIFMRQKYHYYSWLFSYALNKMCFCVALRAQSKVSQNSQKIAIFFYF